MGDHRPLREQYAGRPLELPASDEPTLAEGLECARLGISLVKLRELNAASRKATGKDTRAVVRAGRQQGGGYSFGALPGVDEPPVSLVLPWSTLHSINGMFTIVGKEYQGAKLRARGKISEQLGDIHLGAWQPMTCRVGVDVVLVCPDRRPRDLDNYEKLIYDALKGLVYRDDSLIDDKRMRRDYDVDRPRAEITVTPIAVTP